MGNFFQDKYLYFRMSQSLLEMPMIPFLKGILIAMVTGKNMQIMKKRKDLPKDVARYVSKSIRVSTLKK